MAMDFRDVYSVTVPDTNGNLASAKYILDSSGRRIWGAEEDFKIGTSLIYMNSGWGERTYLLKDDLTVVGRYGDPYLYGGGWISIVDASGATILYHNDGEGYRRSLFYRCRRGMTLKGGGYGSDGGIAMWNVLGNYYVSVKGADGAELVQNTLYAETKTYYVYMTDGTTKVGEFNY